MGDRIRAARERQGLSQQELARRAGVTRQLVGAVEAGRHVPNVGAALALAEALGTSVEVLFSPGPPALVAAAGPPVAPGTAVLTGRVGDALVAVPAAGSPGGERWALADAEATADGVDWLPGARSDGLVVAGCDPVLGLLAELLDRSSGHRVVVVHASTARSLEALTRGTVHGVVVHSPTGALPAPPRPVRRWHVARWLVGLAAPARGPLPSIDELVSRRARVVQREPGAGTQQALERALRAAGAGRPQPGPIGAGHLDVARRVEAGGGRSGVTMEAAAHAYGLGFTPLEEHEVELWLDERWCELPASRALVDALAQPAFLRRAERLRGYDLGAAGVAR